MDVYYTDRGCECKFLQQGFCIDLTPGKSITASEAELSEIRAASRRFSFTRRNFYGRLNNLVGGGNNGSACRAKSKTIRSAAVPN